MTNHKTTRTAMMSPNSNTELGSTAHAISGVLVRNPIRSFGKMRKLDRLSKAGDPMPYLKDDVGIE